MKSSGDILKEAVAALKAGDPAAALSLMIELRDEAQKHPSARLVRGLAEIASGKWPEALRTFAAACAAHPDHGPFFFNLALAQEKTGDKASAIQNYERAFTLGATPVECLGNLSNLYRATNRFADAEKAARRALVLLAETTPSDAQTLKAQKQVEADLLNSLALALARQARWGEAQETLDLALAFFPKCPDYWANMANLMADQLRFDQALPLYAKARDFHDTPLFRCDEAMARLLSGDLARGWDLYESRLEIQGAFAKPEWVKIYPSTLAATRDLEGMRLLLCFEQGLGDTMQFCRFGKYLAARGASLVWKIQDSLVELLRPFLPGIVIGAREAPPAVNYVIPLMSLPRATGVLAPPDGKPYIALAPEARRAAIDSFFANKKMARPTAKHIGLVWSGSPTHVRDADRSIPLRHFEPLWNSKALDAVFYAPFQGSSPRVIAEAKAPIEDLAPMLRDFVDTATCLLNLDLLITVDTSVAHLAGALGVPTYLLTSFCPDWRWGLAEGKTAWYDSVYLLRQPKAGDWSSVITRLIPHVMGLDSQAKYADSEVV